MSSEVINIPTAVALICVVVFAVMLIRTLVKIHRSGGCAGCNGCSGSSGCTACHFASTKNSRHSESSPRTQERD